MKCGWLQHGDRAKLNGKTANPRRPSTCPTSTCNRLQREGQADDKRSSIIADSECVSVELLIDKGGDSTKLIAKFAAPQSGHVILHEVKKEPQSRQSLPRRIWDVTPQSIGEREVSDVGAIWPVARQRVKPVYRG